MLFWWSVTSKWPLADLTIVRSVARSLLRHQIREERTVCTDGCRQTAEFTSAGSFGITCTFDQRCLIELGAPWRVLTLESFNKAQRQWIARRGLRSAASQFLLFLDGQQSDLLPSTVPSTAPLLELLLSHVHFSVNVVAATGDASPVSRSFLPALQIRGTAVRMEQPSSDSSLPSDQPDTSSPARMAMHINGVCEVIAYASRLHAWHCLGGPHSGGVDPLLRLLPSPAAPRVEIVG